MNGFINLYKPSGMSSAYALSKIKKVLGKKIKCGHMGTLDPMASGVLPVAVGKSTRLFNYLLDKDKEYLAEFTFGYQTDTLDADGKVILSGGSIPTLSEVINACKKLIGKIEQIPPVYSAKNVAGTRSYVLARQGIEVELKPKTVEIDDILVTPTDRQDTFSFLVKCKGGTYIRSICRDVATLLNTYATMTKLVRKKSGLFSEENAISAQDINTIYDIKRHLINPEDTLYFDQIVLNDSKFDDLINGRRCYVDKIDGLYKVFDKDGFIGVCQLQDKNLTIKAYIKD